tara:strand:- start:9532 stop:10587 length:1056 start_codon:yes stop_codon:yes gene_type:complete
MRVMIVGGNQLKYAAKRFYDYANKLGNGFIRNKHTVLRFFDRDVARLSNFFRSRKMGVTGANKSLLDQAHSFGPDLVIFIHADVITPDTLERLRENHSDIKLAQLSIDPLFIPGTAVRLNKKSALLDATFITTAGKGLRRISGGQAAYYIPNIVDPSIETGRAFEANCDVDLIFACGSFDKYGEDPRKTTVDLIRKHLPQIEFPEHVSFETGGLWGIDYVEALGHSKCGLNLSREREGPLNLATPDDLYIYSSDRVSHLTGNGVLTFTNSKYKIDELYSDEEMIYYDNDDDLVGKITYFLENDEMRRKIAKKGWEKAHHHLNERLGAQFITDILYNDKFSYSYIWPTEKIV